MNEHSTAFSGLRPAKTEAGGTNDLPRVAAINRGLEHLWRTGLLSEPTLDPEALIRKANRGERSSSMIGGEHWRKPFELLLADLQGPACLNPLGRVIAHGQLVRLLRCRIRAERRWRDNPAILDQPITAPVIIVGQMRSGTTRLQRLLACDPQFAHTHTFETMIPVPFSGMRGGTDRRIASSWASLAFLKVCNPALAAIHPTGPLQPEEEFGLHAFSMCGAQFEAQWRVPRFARWWESADTMPVYRELKALLQTIGWHRCALPGKTWLLKAPQYTQDLASLLAIFPDARLLCLDRDRATVVGSSASLVWHQTRIQSDTLHRHVIGQEWLRKSALRAGVAARVRAANPQVPQFDLHYDEVSRDWRSAVARIYDFLGLDLASEVEATMTRYMGRAAAHHGHRYALEDFGLDRARVDAAFADQRKL